MNNITKRLTYQELEQSLPDYVLGDVSAEVRSQLEDAMKQFPELAAECNNFESFFRAIDSTIKLPEREQIDYRVRNLSYNVNSALNQQQDVPWYLALVNTLQRRVFSRLAIVAACICIGIVTYPHVSQYLFSPTIDQTIVGKSADNALLNETVITPAEEVLISASINNEKTQRDVVQDIDFHQFQATSDIPKSSDITNLLSDSQPQISTGSEIHFIGIGDIVTTLGVDDLEMLSTEIDNELSINS